jgi:uncharacterized protein
MTAVALGHYAIIAWDCADGPAIRDTHRTAHFAYIETVIDSYAIAGPLKHPDGSFAGSLLVVKADSEAAAQAIVMADPYFQAGLWEQWTIHDFLPAAGGWIGGKIW